MLLWLLNASYDPSTVPWTRDEACALIALNVLVWQYVYRMLCSPNAMLTYLFCHCFFHARLLNHDKKHFFSVHRDKNDLVFLFFSENQLLYIIFQFLLSAQQWNALSLACTARHSTALQVPCSHDGSQLFHVDVAYRWDANSCA